MPRSELEKSKALLRDGHRCVVCGWNKRGLKGNPLVVGAHVKPFRDDPKADLANNIITLCPNCHAEFDSYLFYIEPKTHRIVRRGEEGSTSAAIARVRGIKEENFAYRQYKFEQSQKSF